jgi:hypothetical protein
MRLDALNRRQPPRNSLRPTCLPSESGRTMKLRWAPSHGGVERAGRSRRRIRRVVPSNRTADSAMPSPSPCIKQRQCQSRHGLGVGSWRSEGSWEFRESKSRACRALLVAGLRSRRLTRPADEPIARRRHSGDAASCERRDHERGKSGPQAENRCRRGIANDVRRSWLSTRLLAVARITSGDGVIVSSRPKDPIFHVANRSRRPACPPSRRSTPRVWRIEMVRRLPCVVDQSRDVLRD